MMRRSRAHGAAIAVTLFLAVPLGAGADEKSDKQLCIAAAEQGQSQRDDGQYRAARDSFLKCADEACPRVIVQSCTKWLRELNESAPTIVLGAKDAQGNDLTDVKVTFDGAPFATALTGKPMEADAGEHVVRFEREGSVPVEQKLLLRAGERARVVSVTLVAVPVPVDAAVVEAETPPPPPAPPEPLLSPRHVTSGSLAFGAVALAVTAAVFVVESNQKKDAAAALRSGLPASACSGASSPQCTSLLNEVHLQHDNMNVATGLFIGAGGLAVGALATWVFWPKPGAQTPPTTGFLEPRPGGATFNVAGSFQ
jgi:hypothetical protein